MKNTAIERIIKNTGKSIHKKRDVDTNYFYENIRLIEEYCREKLKLNPNLTPEDLKSLLIKELTDYNFEYCKRANFGGKLYELEAIEELLRNPELLKKEYETAIKRDDIKRKEFVIYDSNLEKSCKKVMNDIIFSIREDEKVLSKDMIDFIEKYKKASPKEKRNMEKRIKSKKEFKKLLPLVGGKEIDRIRARLERIKEMEEEEIKDIQIKTMELMYLFLDKFGIVELRLRQQNGSIEKHLGLDLKYELSTDKTDIENIGIKEIFTKDFLKKQSLEDVLTYSSFWQNAFAKACANINQGLFAIDTLDLWQEIKRGNEINISEEQAQAIMKKEECLNSLVEYLISRVREKDASEKVTKTDVERGYRKINVKDLMDSYHNQEGENYKKIFDQILPESENNLFNDISIKRILFGQISNIYRIKDKIIAYKVRSLFRTKKSKNWGIIESEIKNGKRINAIKSNKKKVVVAVDYEGINMPLRLHIDRSLLSDLIRLYNGSTIIPIYEGSDDFVVGEELITTKALMPVLKRHKKIINEASKDTNNMNIYSKNLLEHLQFLINNDKYPRHLKTEKRTKKGTTYERPAKRYVDLRTGEYYEKVKFDYVPIKETDKGEFSK